MLEQSPVRVAEVRGVGGHPADIAWLIGFDGKDREGRDAERPQTFAGVQDVLERFLEGQMQREPDWGRPERPEAEQPFAWGCDPQERNAGGGDASRKNDER